MSERPKPEDFGYEAAWVDTEPGKWTRPEGKMLFEAALHEWEKNTPLITPEKTDANIGIFPELTPEQQKTIEDIKGRAFHAGYKQRDDESLRALEQYQDGLEEGKTISELRTVHAQPYEIESDVTVEYGAKGECKPKASVKITRYLEDGSNLTDLIKADLARGVEEIMIAIAETQKRNAGVK